MLNKNLITRTFSLLAALLITISAYADDAAIANGKSLFQQNCASCHNGDMKTKATGPGLYGVEERWASKDDIYAWVKNSASMIAAGNPRAVAVFNEFGKSAMNLFPNLTNKQIDDILAYVKCKGEGTCGGAKKADAKDKDAAGAAKEEEKPTNGWFWTIALLIVGTLSVILYRTITFLDNISRQKNGEATVDHLSVPGLLTSKKFVGFLTFALICVAGYLTVGNAISLGRQQGYAPEQPIKFSHQLHAGKNQIPCQFCHDLARRSKHSGIPGVSTCMNCHAAVKQGQHESAGEKAASSAEILKIYMAAGFNPAKGNYLPAGTKLSDQLIDTVYKNWLSGMCKDAGFSPEQSRALVSDAIAAASPMFGRPIEWIRIHNLPDHVYYNHEQHVVVGGVQCQTCHGPIEEMPVVYQYSPLSMGWCINCHRKTEVKFAGNGYYDHYYEQYHKELKEGKRDGVTVEDIGGLECQKCHY